MKAINDTKIFITKAEDFMIEGAIPNKAINARYPLAPPCPTEEYRKETINNKMTNKISRDSMKAI